MVFLGRTGQQMGQPFYIRVLLFLKHPRVSRTLGQIRSVQHARLCFPLLSSQIKGGHVVQYIQIPSVIILNHNFHPFSSLFPEMLSRLSHQASGGVLDSRIRSCDML